MSLLDEAVEPSMQIQNVARCKRDPRYFAAFLTTPGGRAG
jgi:hypothetical protein